MRELTALGLGEQLAAAGVLTQELAFYNKHGQLIWTEPRGRAAGYRWPQISISRGELHKVLLAAIRERLGADAVVTGHRLTGFEQRGDKVIARFADPSGKPVGEAEGDILIGADGIHSAVRQHFYPGEKAVFDGYLHYRGIVEAAPYLTGALDGGGRPPLSSRHHLSGDAAAGRQGDDQLARLHENSAGLAAARSLGHRRRQAGLRRSVQGLELSLARRAGPVRGDAGRRRAAIAERRPRSDPALELRPRHADRRRRASDAAGRRAGGLAGGGRRPGAGGRADGARAIRSRR